MKLWVVSISNRIGSLIKRERERYCISPVLHENNEESHSEPGIHSSPEPIHAGTLTLSFYLPRVRENIFGHLSHIN